MAAAGAAGAAGAAEATRKGDVDCGGRVAAIPLLARDRPGGDEDKRAAAGTWSVLKDGPLCTEAAGGAEDSDSELTYHRVTGHRSVAVLVCRRTDDMRPQTHLGFELRLSGIQLL